MTDRIDISDPLCELLERLGLDPKYVGRLTITPTDATVDVYVYKRNENGAMYVENDKVASETLTFEVET